MDDGLLETLLHESEGTALDFKAAQYPFINVTDEAKSELLKDILAFSNSFRRSEAYILIGVKAATAGRSIPVGITEHFDDANIQQFVNSKTNRKVDFSYFASLHQGMSIGILKIPKQPRPTFLRSDFGKLKKDLVYYRIGSSTSIANPDEIASMARADYEEVHGRPIDRLEIAQRQQDTESKKLRLNLYETRLKIFNALTKLIATAVQKADVLSAPIRKCSDSAGLKMLSSSPPFSSVDSI